MKSYTEHTIYDNIQYRFRHKGFNVEVYVQNHEIPHPNAIEGVTLLDVAVHVRGIKGRMLGRLSITPEFHAQDKNLILPYLAESVIHDYFRQEKPE